MSVTKKHLTANAIIIQSDDGVYAQQVNYGTSASTPSNRSVTDVIVRHFEDYASKFVVDKIKTGFICSWAGGSSLDITVSVGTANVKGIEVNSDGIITVTIPATADTYYVVLQKGDDAGTSETRIPLNDTIVLTRVTDGAFDEDTDFAIAKVVTNGTIITSFEDWGASYTLRADYIKPKKGSTIKVFTGTFPEAVTEVAYFSGTKIVNAQDGAENGAGLYTGYDKDFHLYHLSGTGNIINNQNSQDMWVALNGVSKFGFRSTGFEVVNNLTVSGTTLLEGDLTIGGNSIIGTNVNLTNAKLENLDDIGGLSHSNGNFIVSDGTDWVVESGQTALTSLGFGTISNTPAINQDLLTETSNVEFNSIWSGTMWSGASIANAYIDDDITLTNITQITNRAHTNLTAIGLNSHSQIDTHLAGNTASGVTNASNIAGNTASGVTNASNIAGNTASGVTNASNIGTNVSNIAGNTASGVTNASNIAGNTASGVTNASNIATNVTAIGLNTTHRGVSGEGTIHHTKYTDASVISAVEGSSLIRNVYPMAGLVKQKDIDNYGDLSFQVNTGGIKVGGSTGFGFQIYFPLQHGQRYVAIKARETSGSKTINVYLRKHNGSTSFTTIDEITISSTAIHVLDIGSEINLDNPSSASVVGYWLEFSPSGSNTGDIYLDCLIIY